MAKTTTFVSQLIEVLRRIMWNLYRVEWQCVKEDPEAVSRVLELRQHRQETAVRTDMGTTPVRYCVLPLLCARPLLSPPPSNSAPISCALPLTRSSRFRS
jgi:hypothetical protein